MKAKRGDLDGPTLEETLRAFGTEQVVEGVVERAEIGVDLGHDVAGQEPEALARLHGGPGEDDAVRVARLEGLNGQGHGQIRLPRSGRADAEGHHVGGDGVGVALLPGGLGSHGAAPGRTQQFGGEHLGRAHVVLDHGDGPADVGGVEALALLEQRDELFEQAAHPFGFLAVDGDLVAPHDDARAVEGLFDQSQQFVSLSRGDPP